MARRRAVGTFFRIPLGEIGFGYAKVLDFSEVAFLDILTASETVTETELAQAETLFRIWVMDYAFKPKSTWVAVGTAELTAEESVPRQFFKQDALTGALSIYQRDTTHPKGYTARRASREDCVGLERAAVWDPEHVESRLADHFRGVENKWARSLALDQ